MAATAPAVTFATFDTSQKFASLAESLSLAEEECNKFRRNNTIQSSIKIDTNSQVTEDLSSRMNQKCKNKMKQFRGKTSIFKRPAECHARCVDVTSIPDYHKNPHKWTKYSLADVSNEEMSDKSNRQAAFSFLNALKSRKSSSCIQDDEFMEVSRQVTEPVIYKSKSRAISKIHFRKPNSDIKNKEIPFITCESGIKPVFKSSKIVMPEYVVGQKQKNNILQHEFDRFRHVKLDHLQETDEDKGEEESLQK